MWRFRHLNGEVLRDCDVRPLYDLIQNLLLFFFFNLGAGLISAASRRGHRIVGLTATANQNVTCVNLLFFFSIFLFGALPFKLDDVESKIRFH